jgi:hypothetical protein
MIAVSAMFGTDIQQYLLGLGEEGVEIASLLAENKDGKAEALVAAIRENMSQTDVRTAIELGATFELAEAQARSGTNLVTQAIADELGIGLEDANAIVYKYSDLMAGALNPLMKAMGMEPIVIPKQQNAIPSFGATLTDEDFAAVSAFAGGGNSGNGPVMMGRGGSMIPGRSYIVGDTGPELMTMGRNSFANIHPPDRTRAILGMGSASNGGGGGMVKMTNINFSGGISLRDPQETIRFAEMKQRQMALTGGV